MDKKGFGPKTLAEWLLAVVVLVALVLLAISWYNSFGAGKYDPATCRTSNELRYRTKIAGFDSPFKEKCETRKEISETLVKREILGDMAMDMYYCLWESLDGEKDFLSDYDFFGADLYCKVCAVRRFSDEGYKGKIPIDELEEFLDREKIPGGEMTFSEFFTKVEKGRLDFGDGDIMIDTQHNFYVFFMAHKKSGFWDSVSVSGAGEHAGTIGGGVGARWVGKKLGSRFIPGVGWALAVGDVAYLVGYAEEYYPALVIQSGTEAARNALMECDELG